MKSQRLNANVSVWPVLSIVVFSLMCLASLPAISFAAAEDPSQETQEVELYQDDSGEWKVRYLNQDAVQTPEASHQEPVIATAMAEQEPTEVELYQDDSGEWKVRYTKESQAQSPVAEEPAVVKAEQIPAVATAQSKVEEPAVPAVVESKTADEKTVSTPEVKVEGTPKVDEKPIVKAVEEAKVEVAKVIDEAKVEKDAMVKSVEETVQSARTIPMDETELAAPKGATTPKAQPKKDKVTKAATKVQPAEPENPYIWSSEDEESVEVGESSGGKASVRPKDSQSNVAYKEPKSAHDPNNNWELGVEVLSYEYKQDIFVNNLDFNQGKVNEGDLYGLHLAYEHVFAENPPNQSITDIVTNFDNVNRYKFSADYRIGVAEYREKGDLSADVPADDFTQQSLDVRGVGGFDFMITNNTRLTPFLGLGYRFTHDPSGGIIDIPQFGLISDDGTTFSSIFYDPVTGNLDNVMGFSTSTHSFYLPIGLMTNSDITEKLALGLNLEFDYVFIGVQRSSFSDLGPLYKEDGGDRTVSLKNFSNKLKGGLGLKGSVRMTMKQNKFDWYVEPYARYWQLRKNDKQYELVDSDGTTSILYHDVTTLTDPYKHIEPDNTTTEYGVQVGVIF